MDIGLQLILKIFYVGIPKMNKDSMQSELVRFGGGLSWHCLRFGLDVGNKQNNGEQNRTVWCSANKQTKRTNKDCSAGTPRMLHPPLSFIFLTPPSFFLANFLTTDAGMTTKRTPRYRFSLT
jgi:hypothetical protein